jgi:ferrous iron transport protein A
MHTTLNQLGPRQSARITAVRHDGPVTSRLMALGCLPGAMVQVLRVAPLGDPIMVQLGGCRLSLRRDEAAALAVEPAA